MQEMNTTSRKQHLSASSNVDSDSGTKVLITASVLRMMLFAVLAKQSCPHHW
jgi:hypothetical protein